MSSVAIKDLFWEISNDKYASNVWDGYKDIEVVPRRIVEMIIEYCEQSIKNYPHTMVALNAGNIKEYAESLLKQFDEDPE